MKNFSDCQGLQFQKSDRQPIQRKSHSKLFRRVYGKMSVDKKLLKKMSKERLMTQTNSNRVASTVLDSQKAGTNRLFVDYRSFNKHIGRHLFTSSEK